MKKINTSIVKLTISILIILVLSAFTACSSNSEVVPETVESPGYVEDSKIEITSISILSALDPISFGKYPQTIDEEAQVTINKNAQGYYAGSNLNYFARKGNHYYKVEDVVWDAFQLEDGDILLVSQDILYAARYDNYEDYFEFEAKIFDNNGFMFTEAEQAKIRTIGVKYDFRVQMSVSFYTQMFLISYEQLVELYPTTSKVLKNPSDYAAADLEVNEYGNSSWWLAPKKGKNIYVSDLGAISNKSNTYIGVEAGEAHIKYATRGMVPAMIISADS